MAVCPPFPFPCSCSSTCSIYLSFSFYLFSLSLSKWNLFISFVVVLSRQLNPEELQRDVTLGSSAPAALVLERHVAYLQKWGRDEDDYEFAMSEHLRMSGLYWVWTALDLGHGSDGMGITREAMLQFVRSSWCAETGGFGPSPGHDAHILYTLSALQVLVSLDDLDPAFQPGIVRFVQSLVQPDGSFSGDKYAPAQATKKKKEK